MGKKELLIKEIDQVPEPFLDEILDFTPLLQKDVVESTACPHQKAVSTFLRITSKGHSWIDPGDDIDLTAIPLWVRV